MGKKRIVTKGEEGALEERKESRPSAGAPRSAGGKLHEGRVHIYSSYNNTLMALTDVAGNVIANVSAGAIGFKGTKKSTPFAASKVAESLAQTAKGRGIQKIEVLIKGIGPGRDSALRTIAAKGFDIAAIRDGTPVPHNGPRPKKVRRV